MTGCCGQLLAVVVVVAVVVAVVIFFVLTLTVGWDVPEATFSLSLSPPLSLSRSEARGGLPLPPTRSLTRRRERRGPVPDQIPAINRN